MLMLLPWFLLAKPQTTVTVTFPPTPVGTALRLLSEASGRKLAVNPAMVDEVVLARLKDAPVDVALNHLAESLCANWEKRDDGVTWLVPDAQASKKLDQKHANELELHIQKAIASIKKKLSAQPEVIDESELTKYFARKSVVLKKRQAAREGGDFKSAFFDPSIEEETPAWRAIARLATTLDHKVLFTMPDGAREVWAESPTPMQRPFPDAALETLKSYRRELKLFRPDSNVAKVEYSVKYEEERSRYYLHLAGLDSDGVPLDQRDVTLADDDVPSLPWYMRASQFPPLAGESALSVPSDALEARVALSHEYKGAGQTAILEKWRPRLLDPVRYEPTQWHIGEDLVLAAEATGKNLIGTVNDVTFANVTSPGKSTASQVLNRFAADFLPSTDGWLVVRSHNWPGRTSRANAKAVLNRCVDEGGLSIDNAASWVQQSQSKVAFYGWLSDDIRGLFSGLGRFNGTGTMSNDYELQLWASLGSGICESLRKGETISLAKLSAQAMDQVHHFVYWYQRLDQDLDSTDAQPNGITDGSVSLKIVDKPVFYAWAKKDGLPAVPWTMDAKMLGSAQATGKMPAGYPPFNYTAFDSFRVGLTRTYTLNFIINPGVSKMMVVLHETLFDPKMPVVNVLPDSIKQDVEQARLDTLAHPSPAVTRRQVPP